MSNLNVCQCVRVQHCNVHTQTRLYRYPFLTGQAASLVTPSSSILAPVGTSPSRPSIAGETVKPVSMINRGVGEDSRVITDGSVTLLALSRGCFLSRKPRRLERVFTPDIAKNALCLGCNSIHLVSHQSCRAISLAVCRDSESRGDDADDVTICVRCVSNRYVLCGEAVGWLRAVARCSANKKQRYTEKKTQKKRKDVGAPALQTLL